MPRFADVSFFTHRNKSLQTIRETIGNAFVYQEYLAADFEIITIQHANRPVQALENGQYWFKGSNSFSWYPKQALDLLYCYKPDVVMVQGLMFPLQVLWLRKRLGRKVGIIVQHHGEVPFRNTIKQLVQRWADRVIDTYFFTSVDNAVEWQRKKLISEIGKCAEVLEGSTQFQREKKNIARANLKLSNGRIFLWVGRLNSNKDPLTILDGFDAYLNDGQYAELYMIFHDGDLLPQVKERISASPFLQQAVKLVGKVKHEELQLWYSAADYYLSGSHREGSGYALIEAMACGCIPVVTDIPSFRTITLHGLHGVLFPPGNFKDLCHALHTAGRIDIDILSIQVESHFRSALSFEKMAADIQMHCRQLVAEKLA